MTFAIFILKAYCVSTTWSIIHY